MPKSKAEVTNMADHRSFVLALGSVHFAFDGPITEAELDRRVRVITDTIYSLGGQLEDDRGNAVELRANDLTGGADWEGGGDEGKYTRRTGVTKIDTALALEQILEYMDCEVQTEEKYVICTPKDGYQIIYRGAGYDEFAIWQIHVDLKRQKVLEVLSADNSIPLKKKDLEQPQAVVIYHRIRPLK